MSVRTITLSALAVTALAITALTGCAEDEVALGGGSASEPAQGGQIEPSQVGIGMSKFQVGVAHLWIEFYGFLESLVGGSYVAEPRVYLAELIMGLRTLRLQVERNLEFRKGL